MTRDSINIVLATRNEAKVREIEQLLSDLPVCLQPSSTIENMPFVNESEPSLQGNAIKKARAFFEFTGLPALADDTGLEVDALGGKPGVHSARYAGANATDADNRALLLSELRGITNRAARFCTVVAYIDQGGIYLFEGACEGQILSAETGTDGFGYDAVFMPVGQDISFAEMSMKSKNAISHRGRALSKFRAFLLEMTAAL